MRALYILLLFFFAPNIAAQETGFEAPRHVHNYIADTPEKIKVIDFDNDGDKDVIFFNDTRVGWFENMGSNLFLKGKTILETREYDVKFFMEDFDGDQDYDFLISNKSLREAILYVNKNGTYIPQTIVQGISNENMGTYYDFPITVGDINLDGKTDIITIRS